MTVGVEDNSVYYDYYGDYYSPAYEDPREAFEKYCEPEHFIGELCACYRMHAWGIDPEYKYMTCSGEQTVADVCPAESCNLYGCEEAIKRTIQEGANWGIFGFTIAATFYFAGALHLFFVGRTKYKEDF
ncbi:Oidioi.mRNA.OKI2018_I69.XSR.g13548.t1.cds [Oikopleura dioica]|uniref:Oidioi.mRNA.OKI2018_I69.XSR.g13548.t1.cds n=1 Tax=Oikopleura dioica TaxID=34765 RepID=A0ABN7SAX4_OIKDI|nr:Oidioi.mRNA.OKI2018_I69.XSR.g13548.t1.cds [Oikopleura dioica]